MISRCNRRANNCPADNVGVLTSGSTIVGSTIGSTNDFVAPCGSNAGGQDEIFEFAVDGPGEWSFDSCTVPACWDTTLEIREETGGGCPGDFVACDGDGCNVCYYESTVSAFLDLGTTYYLIVDGWSTYSYGDFEITVTATQPCCTTDADCSDGVFCTGVETCVVETGECVSADVPPGAGNPCTTSEGYTGFCDAATDACVKLEDKFVWQAGTNGSFFVPTGNFCPDTSVWYHE